MDNTYIYLKNNYVWKYFFQRYNSLVKDCNWDYNEGPLVYVNVNKRLNVTANFEAYNIY